MLTPEQIAEVQKELVPSSQTKPVRFLVGGQNLNVENGRLLPKGVNVMYHQVYWNMPKATAEKVAAWVGAKAVFSE